MIRLNYFFSTTKMYSSDIDGRKVVVEEVVVEQEEAMPEGERKK